jgi:hypothetical protein
MFWLLLGTLAAAEKLRKYKENQNFPEKSEKPVVLS